MKKYSLLSILLLFIYHSQAQFQYSEFSGRVNIIPPPSTVGNASLDFNSADNLISYGSLSAGPNATQLTAFRNPIEFYSGTAIVPGANLRMILDEDGFLGINAPDPSEYLEVRDENLNSMTISGLNLEWKKSGVIDARITNALGNTVISNLTSPSTSSNLAKFEIINLTNSGAKTQVRVDYSGDIGIGEDIGIVPAAVYLEHKENPSDSEAIGAGIYGVKMQNAGTNNRYFTFYVSDGSGDLYLLSNDGMNNAIAKINSSTGSYSALSDIRFKKNIEPMETVLSKIDGLTPSLYNFKSQADDSPKSMGIMAQELIQYFPEVVNHDEDSDTYHVDYSSLSTVAIKAIQEQQEQINYLKKELENQKNKIESLIYKMD